MLFSILIVLCFAATGAVISRMCGGGKPKLPYGLDQFVYALPYAIFPVHFLLAVLSYAGGVLGKRTGHGQYFHLSAPRSACPPENDERFDFIVRFFFGPDIDGRKNRYWRNFFGMTLSGLWPVLVATIALVLSGYVLAALIVLIGGLLKAPAYAVSQKFGYGTEIGEYVTGAFGWGSVTIAALYLA